jgi:DNA segregation ATPase FtsK/SpoIIIE, S-DNA-T family
LRIIAPIPGTDFVGIELANPKPTMVHLSEVLGSYDFKEKMNHNLTNLSLGKSVDGKLVIKSLEDMPHLLIAGATGQGKSVGVNDFITSLMYQNTPNELKFIMIDPKQVEMELYNGLPYLLCPIITDSDKSLKALKRATVEMDNRYSWLKEQRVKNIQEYNQKSPEKMNRIVIIIDELADLMMS